MHTKVIRAEVVSAYSYCPRKAFLLHCTEDRGTPNDYACILEEITKTNRASYLATLQQTNTSNNERAMSSGGESRTASEGISSPKSLSKLRILPRLPMS